MEKIPSPPVLTLDPNDDNIILEIPEDKDPNEKTTEPVKKEKVKGLKMHSQKIPQNIFFDIYHSYIYLVSLFLTKGFEKNLDKLIFLLHHSCYWMYFKHIFKFLLIDTSRLRWKNPNCFLGRLASSKMMVKKKRYSIAAIYLWFNLYMLVFTLHKHEICLDKDNIPFIVTLFLELHFVIQDQGPNMQSKDPFNLSNDEFYNPKLMEGAVKGGIGTSLIQVWQPVYEEEPM